MLPLRCICWHEVQFWTLRGSSATSDSVAPTPLVVLSPQTPRIRACEVFHGRVEDIEVGQISRDRLYRIRCRYPWGLGLEVLGKEVWLRPGTLCLLPVRLHARHPSWFYLDGSGASSGFKNCWVLVLSGSMATSL